MDMPPTRFRVVERGRRLEVVDTASGTPIGERTSGTTTPDAGRPARAFTQPSPARPVPRAPFALPSLVADRLRASGLDAVTPWMTRAFYDNKGPRLLTPHATRGAVARALPVAVAAVALLIGVVAVTAPFLLVGLWALGNPKVRARLRDASTALLDWLERPA